MVPTLIQPGRLLSSSSHRAAGAAVAPARPRPRGAVPARAATRCGYSPALGAAPGSSSSSSTPPAPAPQPTRRQMLLLPSSAAAAAAVAALLLPPPPAGAEDAGSGLVVVEDTPGSGTNPVQLNDLVLFHYTATVEATGEVFDSTRRPDLTYRDGGPGALRPLALRLGGYPLPGVCAGLQSALLGMRVGGRRTVVIPPALAFGAAPAAAPFAVVPPSSAVRYEIELLRMSRRGPDALMSGLAKCGQGGASASAEGCGSIEPAEFV